MCNTRIILSSALIVAILAASARNAVAQVGIVPHLSLRSAPLTDDEFRLPVSEGERAEMDALIEQLGSPEFLEREVAQEAVIEIGVKAFARLRRAYHTVDDFEVRARICDIVEASYFKHHLLDRNGFLGIELSMWPITHDDDERIPKDHVGIGVQRVMHGLAAARDGVLQEDVIIAIDGHPIAHAAAFGQIIRQAGAGAELTLTILRSGRELPVPVEVTLGARPLENFNQRRYREQLLAVRDRFATWWVVYFRQFPPKPGDGAPPASANP